MYKLELKRLLKTRSTWILMAAALLITLILCCVNIFNPYYYAYDGESLHGLAATEMRRIVTQSSEGEWTPERIRGVFAQLAEANANYGVAAGGETNDSFEVLAGDDADAAAIAGYTSTFLRSIPQVFDVQYVNEITPDMAAQYYTQRKAYIEEAMTLNYGPAAAAAALRLDEDTTEPFYYEFGFGTGSNIASTLPVCLFAVAVACSVICAPVFASDYSTGADDIQRCARYGRKRLGKSRLLAAMTLSTVLYVVCAGVFVALTLAVFGDDKTSAQLALDALVLGNITMNGVLILTLAAGLLSVFAMTAFTLWLSARMRSGVAVLAVTLAVAMTPTFLIVLLRESAVGDWLRLLLPSGGLGLGTGMFVDIQVGKFLTIGSLAIWTPFVMLAAPVIETPVFAMLAQRAYVRREDAALPRRRPRHA